MEPYETSLYEPPDSPDSDSTISGPDDPKRQLILSFNCWVVHCIIPGVVVMAYVRFVPTIRQGAEDLGIELPVVSQWVFYLANTMASYWYLIVAAQVMINLLFAIALAYVPRRFRWLTWLWFGSYLLGMVLLFVLLVVATKNFIVNIG